MADPGLGDQIEAFLRNALDQKRLEDRLVREALSSLRQTLTGIERTLNTSGILSPGPGRDEQIKRLVAAVANSVQRTWGTPQLEVLQEVLTPFFAQQLEFARQMVELSGGTLTSPGAVAASQQLVNQAVNQAVIGGKTLADTLRVSVPLLVADRTERFIRLGMSDLGGEVVATYADAVVRTTSTNVEAIIRTGVHEVGSAAQMAIYEFETDPDWLGPDGLVWTATLDSAVCPVCLAMDGTKLIIGQPSKFWDGRNKVSPHWQCVLGDTPIRAGAILAASRAEYRGKVVTIRTKGGRRLAVTENHPVLTSQGWKAAQFIAEGDQLICDLLPDPETVVNPDFNQCPPTAEQLFALALQQPGVDISAMPASPVDFHGDGAGMDGQIDVVCVNRELLFNSEAPCLEHVGQALFVGADADLLPVTGLGPLDAFLFVMNATATGLICSGDLASALLGGHLTPLEGLRLALSARLDPRFNDPLADAASGNAEPLSNLIFAEAGVVQSGNGAYGRVGLGSDLDTSGGQAGLDCAEAVPMSLHDLAKAHPGLVKLDDVISVDVAAAAGVHVYDFTTLSGAYFAAGILLHNCRCYALPMKWRTEDMTSPSGRKVPVKRPTEGDKGEGSLNFKTAVVDWVRANPETTKAIFGRKIGEMLLGENGQKRIGLDRAVKLWQAPKAS